MTGEKTVTPYRQSLSGEFIKRKRKGGEKEKDRERTYRHLKINDLRVSQMDQ